MKDVDNDILRTFRLSVGVDGHLTTTYLAESLSAKGKTLVEATLNVFRLLPRCQDYEIENLRELIKQHPGSFEKKLLENILNGNENG